MEKKILVIVFFLGKFVVLSTTLPSPPPMDVFGGRNSIINEARTMDVSPLPFPSIQSTTTSTTGPTQCTIFFPLPLSSHHDFGLASPSSSPLSSFPPPSLLLLLRTPSKMITSCCTRHYSAPPPSLITFTTLWPALSPLCHHHYHQSLVVPHHTHHHYS